LILGGLIGYEREQSNRAAGLRTHILVCIGSTTIMLLSIYGFAEFINEPSVRMDPARLAAQVITGIGFLGAGVILYNGISITGLTTAASLWVVAAIGLTIGAGFYYVAGLSTFLVLFSLVVLNKLEKRLSRLRRQHQMILKVHNRPDMFNRITDILLAKSVGIHKFSTTRTDEEERQAKVLTITMDVRLPKRLSIIQLTNELQKTKHVLEIMID